jgi:hypothetical protein
MNAKGSPEADDYTLDQACATYGTRIIFLEPVKP